MAKHAKSKGFANHNRAWVWGRNAVAEAMRAGRWLPLEIVTTPEVAREYGRAWRPVCDRHGIPWEEASGEEIERLCRAGDHQGMAARMPEFPYYSLGELTPGGDGGEPFYVVLDRVQDSFNLGAIVRSAEVLGATAVIIGTRSQTGVNSQVVRSSAGAVHRLPIVRVDELAQAVGTLRDAGVRIVAASEKSSTPAETTPLDGPIALVIGNEGEGISAELRDLCHQAVLIPQAGHISSLNAAVSAGILIYEVMRQRRGRHAAAESRND